MISSLHSTPINDDDDDDVSVRPSVRPSVRQSLAYPKELACFWDGDGRSCFPPPTKKMKIDGNPFPLKNDSEGHPPTPRSAIRIVSYLRSVRSETENDLVPATRLRSH